MKKKKKYLYISIGFVAALAIVLVMGMRQNVDRAQIQEMEQLCSEVLPYISLGEKSSVVAAQASQFSYQGIVASSSELNSGLAKFSNGTFDYYVDSAFDQLRKVESMSNFDLDATPLAEDEILAASDQLFITASGEDIFSGCVKNVSQASDELLRNCHTEQQFPCASITASWKVNPPSILFPNLFSILFSISSLPLSLFSYHAKLSSCFHEFLPIMPLLMPLF